MIGLYIAYVIPIFLRLRMGDAFQVGPWNLGAKYRWMCTLSVIWVGFVTIVFCLPFTPAAVPWNDEFTWSAVNYAPLMVGTLLLVTGAWWLFSARHTFKGPIRTVELDPAAAAAAPAAP